MYRSFLLCCALVLTARAKPTNVVFILSDNQGAWTLGCYGNKDIRTPTSTAWRRRVCASPACDLLGRCLYRSREAL